MDLLTNEFELYGWKEEYINLTVEERIHFFKKNNLKNDADLIKILSTYSYQKNNIFTSLEKIKSNYFVKFITSILMTLGESITLIDGDYEVYILNLYDTKSINIIKDNKTYTFTLKNASDSYIKELLNTIKIEDE